MRRKVKRRDSFSKFVLRKENVIAILFTCFVAFLLFLLIAKNVSGSVFSEGWLSQKDRPKTHPCTYTLDSGVKVTGELTKVNSHLIVCLPLQDRTYSWFAY